MRACPNLKILPQNSLFCSSIWGVKSEVATVATRNTSKVPVDLLNTDFCVNEMEKNLEKEKIMVSSILCIKVICLGPHKM